MTMTTARALIESARAHALLAIEHFAKRSPTAGHEAVMMVKLEEARLLVQVELDSLDDPPVWLEPLMDEGEPLELTGEADPHDAALDWFFRRFHTQGRR